MMRPFGNRRDSAAPGLLVAFFAATVAMVAALALLLREGSGWADVLAIALLLAVTVLVLGAIAHAVGEEEPPGEVDAGDRRAER